MKDKIKNKRSLYGLVITYCKQLGQDSWVKQILGVIGDEVIIIELKKWYWMRHYSYGGQYTSRESISFVSFNEKKSIILNLKYYQELDIANKVIEKVEIQVEIFRLVVMKRLGWGYDNISKLNPQLIYSSSSGSVGPNLKHSGQDLLAQSINGAASLNRKKNVIPVVTAVGQVDLLTSLFINQLMLSALHSRYISVRGQKMEINHLSSRAAFHIQEITAFLHQETSPDRNEGGILGTWIGALYGLYNTRIKSSNQFSVDFTIIDADKRNIEQFRQMWEGVKIKCISEDLDKINEKNRLGVCQAFGLDILGAAIKMK